MPLSCANACALCTPTGGRRQAIYGHISDWDTGMVVTMKDMFRNKAQFNGDISKWQTSAVKDLSGVFHSASSFNANINSWVTSAVTDVSYMFRGSAFNSPLDKWNTGKIVKLDFLFGKVFNQNINSWRTDAVTSLGDTFGGASHFNQPLNSWSTGSAKNMWGTFSGAVAFNQSIRSWNVCLVGLCSSSALQPCYFNGINVGPRPNGPKFTSPRFPTSEALKTAVDGWTTNASAAQVHADLAFWTWIGGSCAHRHRRGLPAERQSSA